MDTNLLKKLGNIAQLAGVRESVLMDGRGKGLHIAEFYNAAGLRHYKIRRYAGNLRAG